MKKYLLIIMLISWKGFAQLEYSDIPMSILAGAFHGISEGYRLDDIYQQDDIKVPNINNKWHTYSALSTMVAVSIPLDIYLTDKNDLWGKAIRGYGDLVLYTIFGDGVMNSQRGFNWWRVSNQSGWAFEQILNPQIKILLLASYLTLRILYDNIWKEDKNVADVSSEEPPGGLR